MPQSLNDLLVSMERHSGPLIELGLGRVQRMLGRLGHPERKLPPVIHIAGTNGKGSLAAYLTAIAEQAGYRVHRYTSPHLKNFNERIYLAGADIPDDMLLDALHRVQGIAVEEQATFFETTTAAAFLCFAETPGDLLVLETGLGGRLDATNVIERPLLTAITPISYDHQAFLGHTLDAIAREKAGILKSGVPCVVAEQRPEAMFSIEAAAWAIASPLAIGGREWHYTLTEDGFSYRSERLEMGCPPPALPGLHQYANAAQAVACVERLKGQFELGEGVIRRGICSAKWPARLQPLEGAPYGIALPPQARLWLDGGHNPAAGQAIAAWSEGRGLPLHLVWSMMADKDAAGFLAPLRPLLSSIRIVPILGHSDASTLAALQKIAGADAKLYPHIEPALRSVCSEAAGACDILIAGSLYLAGQVLAGLEGKERTGPTIRA